MARPTRTFSPAARNMLGRVGCYAIDDKSNVRTSNLQAVRLCYIADADPGRPYIHANHEPSKSYSLGRLWNCHTVAENGDYLPRQNGVQGTRVSCEHGLYVLLLSAFKNRYMRWPAASPPRIQEMSTWLGVDPAVCSTVLANLIGTRPRSTYPP